LTLPLLAGPNGTIAIERLNNRAVLTILVAIPSFFIEFLDCCFEPSSLAFFAQVQAGTIKKDCSGKRRGFAVPVLPSCPYSELALEPPPPWPNIFEAVYLSSIPVPSRALSCNVDALSVSLSGRCNKRETGSPLLFCFE
jgi:hypothetical protein